MSKGIDTSGERGRVLAGCAGAGNGRGQDVPESFRLSAGERHMEAYLLWDGAVYDHSYAYGQAPDLCAKPAAAGAGALGSHGNMAGSPDGAAQPGPH